MVINNQSLEQPPSLCVRVMLQCGGSFDGIEVKKCRFGVVAGHPVEVDGDLCRIEVVMIINYHIWTS